MHAAQVTRSVRRTCSCCASSRSPWPVRRGAGRRRRGRGQPRDVLFRSGGYHGASAAGRPGLEGAGRITAVGTGVDGSRSGIPCWSGAPPVSRASTQNTPRSPSSGCCRSRTGCRRPRRRVAGRLASPPGTAPPAGRLARRHRVDPRGASGVGAPRCNRQGRRGHRHRHRRRGGQAGLGSRAGCRRRARPPQCGRSGRVCCAHRWRGANVVLDLCRRGHLRRQPARGRPGPAT